MKATFTTICAVSHQCFSATFILYSALIFLAIGVFLPDAAAAARYGCTPKPGNALIREISQTNIDQNLFNAAVLYYVNEERCSRGLAKLQPDTQLMRATIQHSTHMAANAYVSHQSRQIGYRDLQDRLAKAHVVYRLAGENVAKSYVFAFDKQPVFGDEGSCSYKFAHNGDRVRRHTYGTLAKDLVGLWMASPTHRSNILHRGYRRAGATFGMNAAAGFCGTIYAVQNFAS